MSYLGGAILAGWVKRRGRLEAARDRLRRSESALSAGRIPGEAHLLRGRTACDSKNPDVIWRSPVKCRVPRVCTLRFATDHLEIACEVQNSKGFHPLGMHFTYCAGPSTQALDVTGDLGLQLGGVPREKTVSDAEAGAAALKEVIFCYPRYLRFMMVPGGRR